jgi:hypothetical protein
VLSVIAGLLVLGGGAFAATQLLGGDDAAAPPNRTSDTAAEPTAATGEAGGGLTRATTDVAVLNGTTIGGLASGAADDLKAAGFTGKLTTGNNTDQQRAESSVLYGQGARRQGREVARVLQITAVEPLDPDTKALGNDADVVVILGADKAP